MRSEILGFEHWSRWSDDEKIGITMPVGVDGASVMQVGQRHDVTHQQLYARRHDLEKNGLQSPDDVALFIPLDVALDPCVLAFSGRAHDLSP